MICFEFVWEIDVWTLPLHPENKNDLAEVIFRAFVLAEMGIFWLLPEFQRFGDHRGHSQNSLDIRTSYMSRWSMYVSC